MELYYCRPRLLLVKRRRVQAPTWLPSLLWRVDTTALRIWPWRPMDVPQQLEKHIHSRSVKSKLPADFIELISKPVFLLGRDLCWHQPYTGGLWAAVDWAVWLAGER